MPFDGAAMLLLAPLESGAISLEGAMLGAMELGAIVSFDVELDGAMLLWVVPLGAMLFGDMLDWAKAAPPITQKAAAVAKIFDIMKRLLKGGAGGLAGLVEHPSFGAWRPMPFRHGFDTWRRCAKADMLAP